MSENPKHLMSIGEVAKSLGITRRIILNYEDKGLLFPDKKDGATGNRYYTPDSMSRIHTIRILQNLGLSLDEINNYYNDSIGLEPLITRLETLRDELNQNIEQLKERVKSDNTLEIRTISLPAQTVYCKTLPATTIEEKKEHLRNTLLAAIRTYGYDTSKRMLSIQFPLANPDRISYCIAVTPGSEGDDVIELPEEKALCIFYHGSYESLPHVRDKILAYAKENNIVLKGICRHIYLEGPPQHKNPEKYITQVVLLIQ